MSESNSDRQRRHAHVFQAGQRELSFYDRHAAETKRVQDADRDWLKRNPVKSDRNGTGHTHPPGRTRCPKCGV